MLKNHTKGHKNASDAIAVCGANWNMKTASQDLPFDVERVRLKGKWILEGFLKIRFFSRKFLSSNIFEKIFFFRFSGKDLGISYTTVV